MNTHPFIAHLWNALDPGGPTTVPAAGSPKTDATKALSDAVSRGVASGQAIFTQVAIAAFLAVAAVFMFRRGRNTVGTAVSVITLVFAIVIGTQPEWFVELSKGIGSTLTGG